MYLVHAQIEIDDIRRPEELKALQTIEFKVESVLALALHAHFGFVKIIQLEVIPPQTPANADVSSLS